MPERTTHQKPRLLSDHLIEAFERQVTEFGGMNKGGFKELVETRAIARELIGHINALEEILPANPNHAGVAGDSPRRTS